MARRHRRTKVQRVVNFVKNVIAFLFSHVGLCALVVGYLLLGSITFQAIESPHEVETQLKVTKARRHLIELSWNTTFKISKLNIDQWKQIVRHHLYVFKNDTLMIAIKKGYDGKEYGQTAQWTFTGAFLFSLTVITTIGYGNTACKTYFGKTVTIMYAIIGIPLMLLFLTNIGDVLAKTFKFLYSRSLKLKMRLVLWHKRRKQARLRRANSLVSRMTRSSGRSGGSRDKFKYDSSADSFPADFDELISARQELEQLEAKAQMQQKLSRVTVPLSLVLLTMIAYLLTGSAIFAIWEGWKFIDSFYFCYISLTTIGFGDLFPGASVGKDPKSQEKLILTSVYLMFGMALIAMCFNLAQEEVVNKVTWIASKLGMVKEDEDDFD